MQAAVVGRDGAAVGRREGGREARCAARLRLGQVARGTGVEAVRAGDHADVHATGVSLVEPLAGDAPLVHGGVGAEAFAFAQPREERLGESAQLEGGEQLPFTGTEAPALQARRHVRPTARCLDGDVAGQVEHAEARIVGAAHHVDPADLEREEGVHLTDAAVQVRRDAVDQELRAGDLAFGVEPANADVARHDALIELGAVDAGHLAQQLLCEDHLFAADLLTAERGDRAGELGGAGVTIARRATPGADDLHRFEDLHAGEDDAERLGTVGRACDLDALLAGPVANGTHLQRKPATAGDGEHEVAAAVGSGGEAASAGIGGSDLRLAECAPGRVHDGAPDRWGASHVLGVDRRRCGGGEQRGHQQTCEASEATSRPERGHGGVGAEPTRQHAGHGHRGWGSSSCMGEFFVHGRTQYQQWMRLQVGCRSGARRHRGTAGPGC
jgi:hypothetical protein